MSWTQENKQIVAENLGKLDFHDIGKLVGKTANAVHLFVHRERMVYRPTVKVNHIIKLLTLAFKRPEYFKPTKQFFAETGVKQIRFWQLYRGEARPTEKEFKAIREHLNVNEELIFEDRQMVIFENEGGGKSQPKK